MCSNILRFRFGVNQNPFKKKLPGIGRQYSFTIKFESGTFVLQE